MNLNKDVLGFHLARITANLTAVDERNQHQLKLLRSQVALWLLHNENYISADRSFPEKDFNENILSDALKKELFTIVEDALSVTAAQVEPFRIVKRDMTSVTSLEGTSDTGWVRGQRPTQTLGPFIDVHGGLAWFDFFQPVQLLSIHYKNDHLPVFRFNQTDIFAIGPIRKITLRPGSIWIRANYLDHLAPANSFAGLQIASGTISFNEAPSLSGSVVVLSATTKCQLELTLATAEPVVMDGSPTGMDARRSSVRLPEKIALSIIFRQGKFEMIPDGDFEIYGNAYPVSYQHQPCNYNARLQRMVIPLESTLDSLLIDQVFSTLIEWSGKTTIDHVGWTIPVTFDDPAKLGEASGAGAYMISTMKGLMAKWINLDGGPLALNETYWLIEPGRIEAYVYNASGNAGHQKFLLWNENEQPKRSSLSLQLQKNLYFRYYCFGPEAMEMLVMNAKAKVNADRPLTSNGKRPNLNFTDCNYSLCQIKGDNLVQCISNGNLEKKFKNGQQEELKPLSLALSNAFAKISPCDEFILTGRFIHKGEVISGMCSFKFGLYSLLPILPDPYVSNLHVTNDRNNILPAGLTFNAYLQALVNWKDVKHPQLTFRMPQQADGMFTRITETRRNRYTELKERSGQRSQNYTFEVIGENGIKKVIEQKVSDIIQEDEHLEGRLKNQFTEFGNSHFFPDMYVLDVSGNVDQFGIGFSNRAMKSNGFDASFTFEGIELVCAPANLSVITLPPIQWEAIHTIQNDDVQPYPYPFPSPAQSLDTGDPAVIRGHSAYQLVPVTAQAMIDDLVKSFTDTVPQKDQRGAAFINLPFGLKSVLHLQQIYSHNFLIKWVGLKNNQPAFGKPALKGANQISITAHLLRMLGEDESPGFSGATIQTRNLIESTTGIVTGLSVLGPQVDIIFNNEFKPDGYRPRVPLSRIDLSGYGASTFSNWSNPDAPIATTSQAKFEVIIGRTAHEVIQVRSILYCCGARLVRTITIQRTTAGHVTRHDSGWQAQGSGLFNYSKEPHAYTFHLGLVKGYYNITNIKDTSRIIWIEPKEAGDEPAQLQEVSFDTDILLEDVTKGKVNGFVSSKGQKGFVQLAPAGKNISASQLEELLKREGPLGGPVDCLINIAQSGQEMRVVRADTTRLSGSKVFVNTVRGSLILPNEGTWSMVQNKGEDFYHLQNNAGLPLVKYNSTPDKYQFTDPAEDPNDKFGLVHASNSHRTLFLAPYINKADHVIVSEQPHFADMYSLVNSNNIFPRIAETFNIGTGDGRLKIHGSGVLELISPGKINFLPIQRKMRVNANFSSYIEYFDKNNNISEGYVLINPNDPEKWKTSFKALKLVYDIKEHSHVKIFHLNHYASGTKAATIDKPVMEFGSFLKPVSDMLKFLDKGDLGAFDFEPSNLKFNYKYKFSYAAKIELETHKIYPFHGQLIKVYHKEIPIGKKIPSTEVIYYGMPAITPPLSYFTGELGIAVYEDSEEAKVFFNIKIGAEMGVMVTSVLEAAGIYAVGIVEFEAVFGGTFFKKYSFKLAIGCAVKINLLKLGEIEGMRAIGIEYEDEHGEVSAVLIQKAEIAIATCTLGVTIEAKAPINKKSENVDPENPLVSLDNIIANFELTLSIELSVAFVINFEYEYTWKEIVPII